MAIEVECAWVGVFESSFSRDYGEFFELCISFEGLGCVDEQLLVVLGARDVIQEWRRLDQCPRIEGLSYDNRNVRS
jgi:hypothetical protein